MRRPSQLCDAATVIGDLDAAGRVCELLGADRDSCPDLEVFTQGVRTALDGLAQSVSVPAGEHDA